VATTDWAVPPGERSRTSVTMRSTIVPCGPAISFHSSATLALLNVGSKASIDWW
jgi:hypothetical protein